MNELLQQLPNNSIGKDGKPYLRPLTSMTEEELRTFRIYFKNDNSCKNLRGKVI